MSWPDTLRTDRPVGIVVAVQQEVQAVRRKLTACTSEEAEGYRFYRGSIGGRAVVLAKSGMGACRAVTATTVLIASYQPCALIIAGFGAALQEGIGPGDLVLADSVLDWDYPLPKTRRPDPTLLALAQALTMTEARIHSGRLRTVLRVVQSAAEKRVLTVTSPDTLALDMETFGAATAAQVSDTPWMAVRAITDGLHDDLPLAFDQLVDASTGETDLRRLLFAVMLQPRKIPPLLRLGKRASLAARNLASFVERYVGEMEDEER